MLKNYIKIAWRTLYKQKTYAGINIFGLTIGLAAFSLITLYICNELSYDRYHTHADRIFRVVQHTKWNGNDLHQAPTSAPFAPALKAGFSEIEDAVRINMEGGGIITNGEKKIKQDDIIFADSSLMRLFSYEFLFGDAQTALSKPQSIVITEQLAITLFGSAENAFNQTIYFDETFPNLITGIIKTIPENSHLRFSGVRSSNNNFTGGWQNFYLYTYVLLKDGVNYKALEKKLPSFAAQTIQKFMRVNAYKMELQPITDIHLRSNLAYEMSANGNMKQIYLLAVIAGLILVIAVINYMNLSTAQYASRIKEIGIRKVIGSEKKGIMGLFITEAAMVTFIAASSAIILTQLTLPLFNQLTGKTLSVWQFGVGNTMIVFVLFSLLTSILAGLYPAVFLAKFKTMPALKGHIGDLTISILFRKSLVGFQFVIATTLIAGSIIIYKQLQFAQQEDLGFNKTQVLTFHIDAQDVRKQVPVLKSQLMQSPLIEGVAAAGNPIGNNDLGGLGYKFEGPNGDFTVPSTPAQELMVDEDYLSTMDIKLLMGRNFSPTMPSDQYGSALINETLMKKLAWENPLGKRMQFSIDDQGNTAERTIVGVVKDFHTYSLQHHIEPLVMVMPPVSSMQDNLYVRLAKGKIPQGLAFLDSIYRQFDETSLATYSFLDENFARQYTAEKKQGKMALVFTSLAILIACLGLFGLSSFAAVQRTREIGIRKVLGASVMNITNILSKDFLKLIVFAVLIAWPIAWFIMHQWLQNFAYHIQISWWMFFVPAVTVLAIALFTVGFQAIKAALANPVDSLRDE